MRQFSWLRIGSVALVAVAAACGRNSSPAIDDALKNDLALAAQAQPYAQPISPNEAGYAQSQTLAPQYAPRALPTRSIPQVRRTAVRRTSSGGSSGGYYPSSAPAEPPVTVEKHTERDAAIGAVAGAVLGATTSRNKVQGGLIGAAIGGLLGGVVGNNVDVKKKVGW